MKIKKYFICKKSVFNIKNVKEFEARQKYEFVDSFGNIIILKLNGKNQPLQKHFFKQHFKQKPVT